MIPSTVSVIDELPLGATGKVDRRALPDVPARTGACLPADDLERLVARVWEDVLEVRPIGPDDDFFALGGDSLAAAEISACLEQRDGDFSAGVHARRFADGRRPRPRAPRRAASTVAPSLVVLRSAR